MIPYIFNQSYLEEPSKSKSMYENSPRNSLALGLFSVRGSSLQGESETSLWIGFRTFQVSVEARAYMICVTLRNGSVHDTVLPQHA